MYGLKRSSRKWYLWFRQAVMSYRLLMTKDSYSKYTKKVEDNFYIIYICGLYVLARNNEEFVKP